MAECLGPNPAPWLAQILRPLEVMVSPLQAVAENLAIDEKMVRAAAAENRSVLRLWWGDQATVVIGTSEKPERQANLSECERRGVAVLRRTSGGGTVLQTRGVFNYSLTAPAPQSRDIRGLFALGATLLIEALARLNLQGEYRGTSDVAVNGRKISGNAQAWRRGGVLLHGTLLHELDLELVEACLQHPPREPDYRLGRPHRDFLTTLRREGLTVTPFEVEAAFVAAARTVRQRYVEAVPS
jgi:lipoate-protein ligase A